MKRLLVCVLVVVLFLTGCSTPTEPEIDGVQIKLSDEKITVDGKDITNDNSQAVYSAKDKVAVWVDGEKLIDEAINNIKTYGFIDDKNKRVREYAPAGQPDEFGENEYTCFGHLYELAWFMMSEGEIKENKRCVKEVF